MAPYLRECLDSILDQTFIEWEAICVDDGSTDGSGAILDEYAAKDGRLRAVHQENCGVSASRNLGISLANGKYITFCDSDDMYAPKWLEVAHAVIYRTDVDMLRMRYFLSQQYTEKECSYVPPMENLKIISGWNDVLVWAWTELLRGGWSFLLFIRRAAFKEYEMFPVGMRMKEDNIFCLKAAQNVNSVCQFDYNGYWYRQRATSAIHQLRPFDDTRRFFYELISQSKHVVNNCRSDVSRLVEMRTNRFLMEDLAGYIASHGQVSGVEREAIIYVTLRARQEGCLRVFSTPKAWCVPLLFMVAFKSILGFPINANLVSAYSKMRLAIRKLLGLK